MALKSEILGRAPHNARLEQAAAGPPSIKAGLPAEDVDAVQRIQIALASLGLHMPKSFPNGPTRVPDGIFGHETTASVRKFQQQVFPTRPDQWDGRVGPKTMAKLDSSLATAPVPVPPAPPVDNTKVIEAAKLRSRGSLNVVVRRMQALEDGIAAADRLDGTPKVVALQALGAAFARDIAIVADKLRTKSDPLSKEFRSALSKAKGLVQRNLQTTSGVIDSGVLGRCDAKLRNPPLVPFANTRVGDPDPRISVCTPFFAQNDDMKRDVITHEFFHLLGLADMRAISSTADALNDANTVAQVVAYMHDRTRTQDSSGMARPSVTYPSP
jgi:hypothetical protein